MGRPGRSRRSVLKASVEQSTLRTFGIRNIDAKSAKKLFEKIYEEHKETGVPVSVIAKKYAKK